VYADADDEMRYSKAFFEGEKIDGVFPDGS
jgi:hypothetical protein